MVGFFCQSYRCDRYHKEQRPCQRRRAGSAGLAHYLQCAICRFVVCLSASNIEVKLLLKSGIKGLTVTDQPANLIGRNVSHNVIRSPVVPLAIRKDDRNFCIFRCGSTHTIITIVAGPKLY